MRSILHKGGSKDTRGTFKLINRKKWQRHGLKEEKKKANRQTIIHKTQHRTLKTKQHEPNQKPKTRTDLRCSGRVRRSCSICDIRRVAYVNSNPVTSLILSWSHSWNVDGIVVTILETYPLSSVKRIFHNGLETGVRKIYEGMISNWPFGTFCWRAYHASWR